MLRLYIPFTVLAIFFLVIDVFALNGTFLWDNSMYVGGPYQEFYSNDKLVGVVTALVLIALDLGYLALTTTTIVGGFKRNIWLDANKMGRYWFIFVLASATYFSIGALVFCHWFSVAVRYFFPWQL